MAKVTIDGKEYDTDTLSDEAKKQLMSMQICDQRIQMLQRDLAISQTARIAYANALKEALPKDPTEH